MQWLFFTPQYLLSAAPSCSHENLLAKRYGRERPFMSKRSCEAAESIEDAVHDNRMARVNCIVLECIRQVITQVPLGGDPVGFLDAGIPQKSRIMAVGADQDGNGSFGDFFPEVSVRIRPALVVS